MTREPKRRIFVSYAHADDRVDDFGWIVAKLEAEGLRVDFDDRVVIPGRRLWPQIEKAILDPKVNAWGWLLTTKGLASVACREELEYARLRALNQRGDEFPLIGIVDRIPAEELPLAIQARLYVDLKDAQWPKVVAAGVEGRTVTRPTRNLPNCHWAIHRNFDGDPEQIAVEVRPRFGSIPYFAVLAPMPGPESVGTGAAGGGGSVSGMAFDFAEWNDMDAFGDKAKVHAMRGPVDPSMSAYAVFRGRVPSWVAFGPCPGPFTLPTGVEQITL